MKDKVRRMLHRLAVAGLLSALLMTPMRHAVAEAGEAPPGDDLILEVSLEKARVYPGESITATVTFLAGPVSVRNIQYPRLKGEAFRLGEFAAPMTRSLVRNGHEYTAYTFSAPLRPLKSGEWQIGPAEISCEMLVPGAGADAFFGGGQPRTVKLRSEPVGLAILPFPKVGRPADFTGAVGLYKVSRQVTPVAVRTGDPVTVTTRIEGTGGVDAFTCPPVELAGVRSYPPRARRAKNSLSCEQVLLPEVAADLTIPGVAISSFDPVGESYRRAESGPVRVVVTRGEANDGANEGANEGTERAPPPPPKVGPSPEPAVDTSHLAAWVAGLLLAGLVVHWIMGRRSARRAPTVQPASMPADPSAWLAEAEDALAAGDPERFHTAVFRGLQAHLGARHGLVAAAITGDVVGKVLRPAGARERQLEGYETLFALCDRARFSPSGGGEAAMRDTFDLLKRVMEEN
jgi:hypothetical protein